MKWKVYISNSKHSRCITLLSVFGVVGINMVAGGFCYEAKEAGFTGLSLLKVLLAVFVSVTITLGVCGFLDPKDDEQSEHSDADEGKKRGREEKGSGYFILIWLR